jgi:hypothetical protein
MIGIKVNIEDKDWEWEPDKGYGSESRIEDRDR